MSRGGERSPDPSARPQSARVLIAGSNLLAGTLARTLGMHGFVTEHTAASAKDIAQSLEWKPDLVLIDLRAFNVQSGSVVIRRVQKAGCQVCVIDHAGEGDRPSAWFRAGSSAVVGEDEPFDELFQTITRLLSVSPPRSASHTPVATKAEPPEHAPKGFPPRIVRQTDGAGAIRALRAHGRPWRRGHREGGLRVDLDCSITDQGRLAEAGSELPACCRCHGASCRVVPGSAG